MTKRIIQKNKYKNQIDSTIGKLFEETKKHIGYQINFDFKINFSEVFSRNGGFDVVVPIHLMFQLKAGKH